MGAVSLARTEVEFPSQGIVHDIAGLPVDCSGWVWTLNNPVTEKRTLSFKRLGLTKQLLTCAVKFFAERIASVSSADIYNTFEALSFVQLSAHFQHCMRTNEIIDDRLIAELHLLPNFSPWRLHYVRWCATWKIPQFSQEVADRLDELKFGGNEKGRAVIERDPLKGAFDRLEVMALSAKLRSDEAVQLLSTDEIALVWLALAFGKNGIAYALMRVDDYAPVIESGTGRSLHKVRVPRTKKGDDDYRKQFSPHILNDEIGAKIASLVAWNRMRRDSEGWPEGCALPLFPRKNPRQELLGGPRHEYAMHRTSEEVLHMLKDAVAKLDVISHRTGEKLRVNPRRFRRTFATRAVEENASPAQLAAMLDHTDLQNVMVYFETRSSQVERLPMSPESRHHSCRFPLGSARRRLHPNPPSRHRRSQGSPRRRAVL
jgi:integrase